MKYDYVVAAWPVVVYVFVCVCRDVKISILSLSHSIINETPNKIVNCNIDQVRMKSAWNSE